jgi:hypothetical protein
MIGNRISALRDEITVAWGERRVISSGSEQERLHHGIATTCKLLADLPLSRYRLLGIVTLPEDTVSLINGSQ